jgi:hypothetical protein
MFREYTYTNVSQSECLNLRRQKAGYCSFTQKHPPTLPTPPYPFVSPSFQCSNWPILLFLSTWLSFPSPLELFNGTLLRATETSLYVTSLNVNAHKVGVESHKTEMSQKNVLNVEEFKIIRFSFKNVSIRTFIIS